MEDVLLDDVQVIRMILDEEYKKQTSGIILLRKLKPTDNGRLKRTYMNYVTR